MIEVLTTILLLSLLITAVYSPQIKNRVDDYHISVSNAIADEIYQIGNAAQNYLTQSPMGEWPDVNQECAFAINALKNNGFLPPSNVIPHSERSLTYRAEPSDNDTLPFDVYPNQAEHIGQYYTRCPEFPDESSQRNYFYIRYAFATEHNKYAAYVSNQLPSSEVLRKDDVFAVEVAIPLPAEIPLLNSLLSINTSRPLAEDLDVGENVIANARDIELMSGQTLGAVTMETAIVAPLTEIAKPNCPEEYVPTILVTPTTVSHSSGYPIIKVTMFAIDIGDHWRIRSRVSASNVEPENDYEELRGAVITRCIR